MKNDEGKRKAHRKDRKDGYYLKRTEPLSEILAHFSSTKMANVIYANMPVDVSNLLEFVEEEKAAGKNTTLFGTLVASTVRLCAEKTELNRFVKNRNLYERKWISAGYVILNGKGDAAKRSIVSTIFRPSDTLQDITSSIYGNVDRARGGDAWGTEAWVNKVAAYPGPFKRLLLRGAMWLDKRGWVPTALTCTDPCSATVLISNLGSINAPSVNHYLIEWGTNSIFICPGKIRYESKTVNGVSKEIPIMDVAVSIDGRIADGNYLSGALAKWVEIINNPRCLIDGYEGPKDA